mgnify:CR=1 FL=1
MKNIPSSLIDVVLDEWTGYPDHLALDEIGIYLEKKNITESQEAVYASLYEYMTVRLLHANMKNDKSILDEVLELLELGKH